MGKTRQEKWTEEKLAELPIVGRQPQSEKEEKYMREVCEFEFYNLEEPGLGLSFPYGSTREHATITLQHGEKKKLPRFIAQHIERCSTPIWDWRPDGTGRMAKQLTGTRPRFRMSLSFN